MRIEPSIHKKPKSVLDNSYSTLVRTVLVEKIPFIIFLKDDMEGGYYDVQNLKNNGYYLVRNCVSLKEVLNGLTKGLDWNQKRYNKQHLSAHYNFKPTNFYMIIKGLTNKDKGKVLFKEHCVRSVKNN